MPEERDNLIPYGEFIQRRLMSELVDGAKPPLEGPLEIFPLEFFYSKLKKKDPKNPFLMGMEEEIRRNKAREALVDHAKKLDW